jgi:ATP-dependent RNA helicase DDX27
LNKQLKQRVVPEDALDVSREKVEKLQNDISRVMQEERMQKEMEQAEMELKRAQNLIEHKDEIMSRPKKTWFQTTAEKQHMKEKMRNLAEGKDIDEPESDGDDGDEHTEGGSGKHESKSKKHVKGQKKEDPDLRRQKVIAKSEKKRMRMEKLGQVTPQRTHFVVMLTTVAKTKKQKKEKQKKEMADKPRQEKPKAREQHKAPKRGALQGRKSFKSKARHKRR